MIAPRDAVVAEHERTRIFLAEDRFRMFEHCRREKHVHESMHRARWRVRLVGQRLHAAQRVMQARGGFERNARFFEAEADKLDGWADDLKVGLERELKELDRQGAVSDVLSQGERSSGIPA